MREASEMLLWSLLMNQALKWWAEKKYCPSDNRKIHISARVLPIQIFFIIKAEPAIKVEATPPDSNYPKNVYVRG